MKKQHEISKMIDQYVLDILDFSDVVGYEGYPKEEPTTNEGKAELLNHVFMSEYGWSIPRYGRLRAMAEWLQGLPSCVKIDYTYVDIEKRGREWGLIRKNASEETVSRFLENWWLLIASHIRVFIDFPSVRYR